MLVGHGIKTSVAALWRFFARLRITAGMIGPTSWSSAGLGSRADSTSLPSNWCSSTRLGLDQHGLPTWLPASVPHGHWKTTFVAGPRRAGMIAPMVLHGQINRGAFWAYIDQVPAPELRPGD